MEPNPHKDLKTLLNDALELKNVDHEKLAQLTGVSERYIWAIQNLETDKLPSLPYVRGYIKKISETLGLDHDELWHLYEKELEYKTSGAYDKLPVNRFAIKQPSRKTLVFSILGILLIFYLIFNLRELLGKPKLAITNPETPIIAVSENLIQLTGNLEQRDKLSINGEEIFVGPDGNFSKDYTLQPGLNTIEFKAKRFLGREVTINRQIMYQPASNLQLKTNNK